MHQDRATRKIWGAPSAGGLPFAALIGGNIALAFGPWLVRLADVGPVAAGFWRLAIALPLLIALTAATRQRISAMPRLMWGMLALGGLFFAADLGAWHAGIHATRLANATLFGNITSFIFAIYGFVITRSRPSRAQGAAFLLAIAGVALLMGRSYELSRQNLVGDLLCVLAGVFYFFYLVAIERARGRLQAWPALTLSTLFGVAPLLLFANLLGERVMPGDWTPLVLLAIGSQVVGQGLLVYAIGNLSPVIVGLGLLTQPAVAAAIGWLAYDERLAMPDLAGMIAIGAAMVLVRRPARKTKATLVTPPPA